MLKLAVYKTVIRPVLMYVLKRDLGTEKGLARLVRKNRDMDVEMDDGSNED